MHRREPAAQRDLRGGAVNAADVRIAHERDVALARHERAEPFERSDVDVDACGCEDDVVDVVGVCVRDLVVELAPALVQRVKLRLVAGERPASAGAPLPGRFGIDLEQDGERAATQLVPDRAGLHRAPA